MDCHANQGPAQPPAVPGQGEGPRHQPRRRIRPRRPKRNGVRGPRNAFCFFSMEYRREQLLRENPRMGAPEMGRRAGDAWREMTADQRRPYVDLARQDQQRYYQERFEAYRAAGPNLR